MEYTVAKVEKDGSDSHGGQTLNDAKAADKSKILVIGPARARHGDNGQRSFSDKLQIIHSTQLLQETKSGPTVEDCSREGAA